VAVAQLWIVRRMSDLSVHNTTKEEINMKNITRIFVVCAALFACSSLFGAPSTGKSHHHRGCHHGGYHQSGVFGQVDFGSRPSVFPVDVQVISGDGQHVTDFLTDADGSFEVDLKPGTYILVAYFTYEILPFRQVWFSTPVTVTVDKKQFAAVILTILPQAVPALSISPPPY
jgi:hypothetical protein